jgi:hypothetical protein
MASKIKSRQERVNVHVARVLSELGLSTRAETWFLNGLRAPDFIIMHPLVHGILGEAEVGDIDTVCDEAIIDRLKIRERVAKRFADPRLADYNFILLLLYRRKDLEELAELDDSRVAKRVKTLKVCLGLAVRAEAYGLSEHYIHIHREPVEITCVPSVLNILINEFFQKTFKKTLSIKRVEQLVDKLVSLIDLTSSNLAREIIESDEREKLQEKLREVSKRLSIAWDIIKDPLDRIKLTYKTMLLIEALGMMLYEIVSKKYFLEPLDCQRLSHETLAERLKGLVDRGKYNELNSSFLELLKSIPSHELLDDGLRKICGELVQETPLMKPASSIVLSMLYQRILSETFRHAFATFYTKMPAAKILAGLAVESFWDRVADPACGTGSLLLASLERRMLMLSGKTLEELAKEAGQSPVLEVARSKVLENTVGLDVLKPAVLMSALNLRIATYGSPPHTLNLYHVPVGEDRAGSLDILTGVLQTEELLELLKGGFDLVIMNPPFTRSDRISALIGKRARETLVEHAKKGKLMFGHVKVKDVFKAGMAKPFMVLADKLVKDGGRIAAVLPTSTLSRPLWSDIREGLVKNYSIEYIVISWAPGTPNFSSDTNLREILLVARKSKERPNLKVIGLLKRVDDLVHADIETIVKLAREVNRGYNIIVSNNVEVGYVMVVDRNFTEKFSDNLYRLIAFKNPKLLEFHHNLIRSGIRLGDLFYVGSVIDHTSGLRVVNRTASTSLQHPYPGVWGSGDELSIRTPLTDQAPHIVGVEREDLVKIKYWSPTQDTFYSAKLFTLRRGRLSTQYILALSLNEDAVSNVWWPLRLKDRLDRDLVSKFLVFMNSTFGFFHLLGERLETEGLFVEYKKQHLANILLPDLRKLPAPSQEVLTTLRSPMPRFDDYLELLAKLNKDRPSFDAANRVVEKYNEYSPRARLDLEVIKWLTEVFKLKIPQDFYILLHEEVKTLRSIMERSHEEEEVIEDEPERLIATKHRTLEKWFVKSK